VGPTFSLYNLYEFKSTRGEMKTNLLSFIVETNLVHLENIHNSSGNPRERLLFGVLGAEEQKSASRWLLQEIHCR